MCYKSKADYSPNKYTRVSNNDQSYYELTIGNVPPVDTSHQSYPELSDWFTTYGGTIDSSVIVKFGIGSGEVYPGQHPTYNQRGRIDVKRMAVDMDNEIVETTDEYLWRNWNLTHRGLAKTQGGLECDGRFCTIKNLTMYPGEIYQLTLYSYSLLVPATSSYLFGSSFSTVQPLYSHLFFVRGWTLSP